MRSQTNVLPLNTGEAAAPPASQAAFTVAGSFLCRAMDLWDETMITMALVVASVIITLVFAIPLGIAAGSNRRVSDVTRVPMDFLQTMPPHVYLMPASPSPSWASGPVPPSRPPPSSPFHRPGHHLRPDHPGNGGPVETIATVAHCTARA